MTIDTSTETPPTPNWRHVGVFPALNFGLTYLLDLAIYLRGGLQFLAIAAALQFQMLLPYKHMEGTIDPVLNQRGDELREDPYRAQRFHT